MLSSSSSASQRGLTSDLLGRLQLLLALHEINDHELELFEGALVLSEQLVPHRDLGAEAVALAHLREDVIHEVGLGGDIHRLEL